MPASPAPLEVTAARKADRVAWMAYDRGLLVSQGSFEQTKLAAPTLVVVGAVAALRRDMRWFEEK